MSKRTALLTTERALRHARNAADLQRNCGNDRLTSESFGASSSGLLRNKRSNILVNMHLHRESPVSSQKSLTQT